MQHHLKFVLRLSWTLHRMLQVLLLNLFDRRPLVELFTTPLATGFPKPSDAAVVLKMWDSSDNRLNAHSETAHQLGWLLLDALGIDDLFAPGEARSFSFLLNMNQLFERFVTRVVEQVLPVARYRVTSQVAFRSVVWNVSSQRPYTNIIPDVVVERRGESDCRVAIDAKYKQAVR